MHEDKWIMYKYKQKIKLCHFKKIVNAKMSNSMKIRTSEHALPKRWWY